MHAITTAIARARIDHEFQGHNLTPAECVELSDMIDRNEELGGLVGPERERFDWLLHRATIHPRYVGPDDRY